jgi:preprotein translocase subunit YajC
VGSLVWLGSPIVLVSLLAQDDAGGSGGAAAFQLVFFALIFVAMYFFLIRPQRRRMRETQVLQSSLEVGDEVLLNSGVFGFISAIEGDIVWLDIADDVEIRVTRSAIARKIAGVPGGDAPEPTAD